MGVFRPGFRGVLVVVDVQVDFLPGGALAVPEGDLVVPVIDALAERFAHVVATQDWHPPGHLSFASAHPGRAAFVDSYSGFRENDRSTPRGLAGYLRERGLQRLFLAGLARDYCVHLTAGDALELGFEVTIVEDTCRGIDPAAVRQRRDALQARGARGVGAASLLAAGSRDPR